MSNIKITAKPISQLPIEESLVAQRHDIWFEISKPLGSNKYQSTKCNYETLRNNISADTDGTMREKYHLYTQNGYVANVKEIDDRLSAVESGDIELSGQKSFSIAPNTPIINIDTDRNVTDSSVTNVGVVKQIVSKYGSYYSDGSRTEKCPINYVNGAINGSVYEEYKAETPFYYWHIDHGQTDSANFVDQNGIRAGGIYMNKTGMLTMYGWLADNGSVKAQESWVGLFAEISEESQEGAQKYMPIQIVPWIQGTKHAILQYVGFNVAVREGMRLKVMTGFAVNGTNSGLDDGRCLLFKDSENMPNTFVGYIVENGGAS